MRKPSETPTLQSSIETYAHPIQNKNDNAPLQSFSPTDDDGLGIERAEVLDINQQEAL